MPFLLYDNTQPYDTPRYTYDGELIRVTFKQALFIELRSVLDGLVLPDHICLDMRLTPEPYGTASWVVFTRVTESRSTAGLVRERWELQVICPQGQDDTLEAIRNALVDSFAGAFRYFMNFRTKGHHINTIEDFDSTLEEKSSLLIFAFHHLG